MDLELRATATVSCRIHPVVIFNVLDHFIRRNKGQSRVIGSLTGVFAEGVVEIRNSFPVPHTEGDQVGVDIEFLHNVLDLHHKVSSKEVIVGWYATGPEINDASAMIHDFYWKEMNHPPVHLLVDTNLTNYTLSTKTFISNNLTINEKALGAQFMPVPLEYLSFDAARVAVETFGRGKAAPGTVSLESELLNLETSVIKLDEMLTEAQEYVSKVVEGKEKPNAILGRLLSDAVGALPKIDPQSLEKMFSSSLQDLLLVVYLANLTRTQLTLAERLQRSGTTA
eukprot:TRINITY_DN914_c0_g1_i1.p1 TRINITY_DN914_c0_g1~~TRINITY_DN914_c0_g1_i1.p1  ORF type:complete len:319 (+),score=71.34 TRINITY_DN914_c0_g1_i1:114-959(+)